MTTDLGSSGLTVLSCSCQLTLDLPDKAVASACSTQRTNNIRQPAVAQDILVRCGRFENSEVSKPDQGCPLQVSAVSKLTPGEAAPLLKSGCLSNYHTLGTGARRYVNGTLYVAHEAETLL